MRKNTTVLGLAAATLMVLLLSGGYFAYAYTTNLSASQSQSGGQSHAADQGSGSQDGGSHHQGDGDNSTSTSTANEHETSSQGDDQGQHGQQGDQHELQFKLVPTADSFAGHGQVNVHLNGTTADVHLELSHANESATYSIYLIVIPVQGHGTSFTTFSSTSTTSSTTATGCGGTLLGTLVTNDEGNGQAHNLDTSLSPGTYDIGLVLCIGNKAALITHPTTENVTVTSSGTTTSTTSSGSHHEITGDDNDENQVKHDINSKVIPAVVVVSGSSVTTSVNDHNFSVSVGQVDGHGYSVTIAGNVTGSRVLLINLTKSVDISGSGVTVMFDGKQIQEASSLTQVLNTKPTDQPSYIILSTSSGTQLLVGIPHFSTHVIQLLSSAFSSSPAPVPDIPLLGAVAVAVGAIAVALAYSKGRRVYAKMP